MSETNGNGKKAEVEPASFLRNLSILLPTDEEAVNRWPTVVECLYPKYKGTRCTRQAGRLSIRVEGTYYNVTVECPTERLMTSVKLESLDKLFDALEAHIRTGGACWVPNWDSQKKSRPVIEDVVE